MQLIKIVSAKKVVIFRGSNLINLSSKINACPQKGLNEISAPVTFMKYTGCFLNASIKKTGNR
jgi:hypothetical protein